MSLPVTAPQPGKADEDSDPDVPEPAEAPEGFNPKQRVAKPGPALPDRMRKNTREFAHKQRQSARDKALAQKREEEVLSGSTIYQPGGIDRKMIVANKTRVELVNLPGKHTELLG